MLRSSPLQKGFTFLGHNISGETSEKWFFGNQLGPEPHDHCFSCGSHHDLLTSGKFFDLCFCPFCIIKHEDMKAGSCTMCAGVRSEHDSRSEWCEEECEIESCELCFEKFLMIQDAAGEFRCHHHMGLFMDGKNNTNDFIKQVSVPNESLIWPENLVVKRGSQNYESEDH